MSGSTGVDAKERGLEAVLKANQSLIERLGLISNRIRGIDARLHGHPDTGEMDKNPQDSLPGIMSGLHMTATTLIDCCEAIEDRLGKIEATI